MPFLPFGAVAQLGERQLCKLDVVGSNPISSTRWRDVSEVFDKSIRARERKEEIGKTGQ